MTERRIGKRNEEMLDKQLHSFEENHEQNIIEQTCESFKTKILASTRKTYGYYFKDTRKKFRYMVRFKNMKIQDLKENSIKNTRLKREQYKNTRMKGNQYKKYKI